MIFTDSGSFIQCIITKSIVKELINLQLRLIITTPQLQRMILNKYYVFYIYIYLHFNNTQNKHFQIKLTNMQQAHYFVTFPIREFNKLSVTVFLAKQTILCVCV